MSSTSSKVFQICRRNGLSVTGVQQSRLERFVELLIQWNQRINLISRLDIQNIWLHHILHSISPLFVLTIPPKSRLLDLGTGGGLPGVPLSILREDLQVKLLDSVRKKTHAVNSIVETLALSNVEVLTGRAEELPRIDVHQSSINVVISRAVAPLADLIKWSRQLVPHGAVSNRHNPDYIGLRSGATQTFSTPILLAMKGGDLENEIRAAEIKCRPKRVLSLDIAFEGSDELRLIDKKIVLVQL